MLMSRGKRSAALAACAAFMIGVAGCGTEQAKESADSLVRLYGADGNMISSFATEFADHPGTLDGMKGTKPLTPLSDDFIERLASVDPKLDDHVYSGEAYDAVVISALAAQLAGSTAPAEIAKQINGVTTGGQICDTITECFRLARNGTDIQYRGVSLKRGGFTDAGEPSTASYAIVHFGSGNELNAGKMEFIGTGDETTTSTASPPAATKQDSGRRPTAPLKIGGLLPRTGDLALAYPPLAAGAALAIREVNDAGGVLGADVVWLDGDDGTNAEKAKETVQRHIAAGVHVILGAGASGISRAVLPDVVAAGLILFSPCNTDAGLSTVDDKGLYFRTAPSDLLQGRALADVILRDGPNRIVIIARKDSYGQGLQENVRTELERVGISGDRVRLLTYDPPADSAGPPVDFAASARQVKEFGPDAALVIGFAESAEVIKALVAADVRLWH